ncbi:MAG: Holliday junction branch migration protein RuvA [Alphaproteobacteria bacterium]|nr:Holliday junction branch migration protein RuvA [Alphaproteobacteria bacterium]
MIGKLKGTIDETGTDHLVLDVGGVGYLVHVSARTLGALEGSTAPVTLHIETHLREESLRLYGFPSPRERDWFRALQTVQGVGAKVALAVLSVAEPDRLAEAVFAGDEKLFARAAGVGPKLAKRLASELKDRMPAGAPVIRLQKKGKGAAAEAPPTPEGEALSALVNLGYAMGEAQRALAAAQARAGSEAALDRLIVESLRELAR